MGSDSAYSSATSGSGWTSGSAAASSILPVVASSSGRSVMARSLPVSPGGQTRRSSRELPPSERRRIVADDEAPPSSRRTRHVSGALTGPFDPRPTDRRADRSAVRHRQRHTSSQRPLLYAAEKFGRQRVEHQF